MIERDETGRIKKIVTTEKLDPLDILYEEERLRETRALRESMAKFARRLEELEVLASPKREELKFQDPYQFLTVQAGTSARVYWKEIPEGYVGVINRLANTWFANTYYVVSVDNVTREQRLERSVAAMNNPLETQQFAERYIEWTAYNDDVLPHVFEVLCDGHYIKRKMYERIRRVE